MPPEALQLVDMLLDVLCLAPGRRVFQQAEDEIFQNVTRFSFVERDPTIRPTRRQSSEAEDVAMPGNSAPPARTVGVPDESQQPHE